MCDSSCLPPPSTPLTASTLAICRIKGVNNVVFTCAAAAWGTAGRLLPALSQPGVSERQVHVEPNSTPLPANGRNGCHDSPKINREPL